MGNLMHQRKHLGGFCILPIDEYHWCIVIRENKAAEFFYIERAMVIVFKRTIDNYRNPCVFSMVYQIPEGILPGCSIIILCIIDSEDTFYLLCNEFGIGINRIFSDIIQRCKLFRDQIFTIPLLLQFGIIYGLKEFRTGPLDRKSVV